MSLRVWGINVSPGSEDNFDNEKCLSVFGFEGIILIPGSGSGG